LSQNVVSNLLFSQLAKMLLAVFLVRNNSASTLPLSFMHVAMHAGNTHTQTQTSLQNMLFNIKRFAQSILSKRLKTML